MSLRSNRPGFALPMALMIMVFLTVGVATAYARGQSEVRADRDREATSDAFAYAQSGLEQFAMNRVSMGFSGFNPAPLESTRIAMPTGYADVIMQQVRAKSPGVSGVYLIRSRGIRTGGATALAGRASHTVTQYGIFREGQMQILSAWTSLSGLEKNGTSGTVTGVDNCAMMPDVAGVALPDGTYVQNGGTTAVPTGTPPILYLGNQTQTNNAVTIDWDGIVNHYLLWPDVRIPADPWPSWAGQPNWYPIVRVDGNITLPSSGQGILIVTGDLVINGVIQWGGIILVGGTIYADGNNNVLGAVVSGLNEKLGINVATSDIGNGTKTYQYDSCEIAKALSGQSAMILLGKTWTDNWPSY